MKQQRENFQGFLVQTYRPALERAQHRLYHHQLIGRWLGWMVLVFSVLTTLLLAVSTLWGTASFTPLIAICSAVVTAVMTMTKSLDPDGGRAFYQKLEGDLRAEYTRYEFGGGAYRQACDKESLFVERTLTILMIAQHDRPRMTYIPSGKPRSPEGRQSPATFFPGA